MKKMLLIFSGYNQRAVVAFLRELKKSRIDNFRIIAASEQDPILVTDYKDSVSYVRRIKQLDLDEIFFAAEAALADTGAEVATIVPSTEALNRFALENREIFRKHRCEIPLVEAKRYYEISDKETFWKLCKNRGLTVPENIEVDCWQGQPFVAKPKHYFSSDGKVYAPVIVQTEEEYQAFTRNYRREDFDLQEFVRGESFYLLYYFAKNGTVLSFSQENIAQQPNGKSILAAVSRNLHTSEISRQFEALFKDYQFVGFVMIELRKCKERYYMIEANPRLWGPTQLYVDAGVPLIEAFLQDTGFLKKRAFTNQPCETYYYWSGGCSSEKDYVWHGPGRQFFQDHWENFKRADMYNRPDTINVYRMENVER